MKIIHVMECFAGGTFEFLTSLTQELSQYEYIVIHGQRENTPVNHQEKFPKNTIFIPWKNVQREISPLQDLKALMELTSILKQHVDAETIVHLHSSKAGFLGRVAAFRLGIQNKIVYTAHGVSFLRTDIGRTKERFYTLLEKIASHLGGNIVACSQSEGNAFQEKSIRNVTIINNGIDIPKDVIKEVNEQLIIGTVGRITYQKNPQCFNWIAEQFQETQQIRFLWIGDGELRSELKSPNLEITGWLDKTAVRKEMQKIDIYLSTSLWEGLPLSVLEAMALGKPVILSDCVGNRDLVDQNGYLFTNRDNAIYELKEIIQNQELRDQLGQNSLRDIMKCFSLAQMAEQYSVLYQSIEQKIEFSQVILKTPCKRRKNAIHGQ